jgi:hypothetical protein
MAQGEHCSKEKKEKATVNSRQNLDEIKKSELYKRNNEL